MRNRIRHLVGAQPSLAIMEITQTSGFEEHVVRGRGADRRLVEDTGIALQDQSSDAGNQA